MASGSINGLPLIKAHIIEPGSGIWTARVELDAEEDEPSDGDSVTITIGDVSFVGTVDSGKIYQGRWIALIRAGANKLSEVVPARYYHQGSSKNIIDDIIGPLGEKLSPLSDPSAFSRLMERWSRVEGEAGNALSRIVAALGLSWVMERDGTIRIFNPTSVSFASYVHEFTELHRDPTTKTVIVSPGEEPDITPFMRVGDDNIFAVETIYELKSLRQILSIDKSGQKRQAASKMVEAMRRANKTAILYSQAYHGKIVKQDSASGELDVFPDDDRLKGTGGFTRVPMRHGIPGLTVKVKPGESINLMFENGDPAKPIATMHHDGSGALEMTLSVGAVPSTLKMAEDGSVELSGGVGGSLKISASGDVELKGIAKAVIDAVSIELGAGAAEAIVKGTSFMAIFNGHTHTFVGVAPAAPGTTATPLPAMTAAQLSTIGKVGG